MTTLFALVAQALHAALMLAVAPLLAGGIDRLRARLSGRTGPPLMQPWRDWRRLARKQPVAADGASWLLTAAPFGVFAFTWAAAALVPSFATGMATGSAADLIVIFGLLAGARCTLVLAGMDAGSALGGVGAGRALLGGALADPALLLVILTLALVGGSTGLDGPSRVTLPAASAPLLLAAVALGIVALVENRRGPFGGTAPELAMTEEALALEYSGRHLLLIEWARALRLLLWLSLIVAAFVPFGAAPADQPLLWAIGLLAWAVKIAVLGACVAALEAGVPRLRQARVAEALGVALLLGVLAAILLFASQGLACEGQG